MSFIRVPTGAIVITASMAVAAPSAHAAEVQCQVPFSFLVNGRTLPPGTYHVVTDPSQGEVLVQSLTSGVFVLTERLDVAPEAHARLVFHRYGDEYVLRQVWTGHGTANQLPEPRRERELRAASLRGGAERGLVVVMLRAD